MTEMGDTVRDAGGVAVRGVLLSDAANLSNQPDRAGEGRRLNSDQPARSVLGRMGLS